MGTVFLLVEHIQLNDVQYLVVDEADTLFDRSFREATMKIINSIKVRTMRVNLNFKQDDESEIPLSYFQEKYLRKAAHAAHRHNQ